VTVSARGSVNIVPRDVLSRPTQLTAMMAARLPEKIGDRLGVMMRRITVGDLSAHGLEMSELPPSAQLRVYGRTPVMDVGTVARIKSGQIRIKPGIDHLTVSTVVFTDGSEEDFDDIVLATGYRPLIEEVVVDQEGLLDANGLPREVIGTGDHRGLFFIGFDNYRPGGILGSVLEQSETVAAAIAGWSAGSHSER
jgi:hypothetical protein